MPLRASVELGPALHLPAETVDGAEVPGDLMGKTAAPSVFSRLTCFSCIKYWRTEKKGKVMDHL